MDMTGEYRIAAPRQKVWEALNDPEILRQSIVGCDEIDKQSDTEMTAKVTAKVGPVKAKFGGKVTLSDLDPPNGYTITGEGSGGAAGFAKGGATVKLVDVDGGSATLLSYTVRANVGGKLAQIGSRLIDATARKMAEDFFSRFSAIVGAAETPPAAAVDVTPTAGAPAPAEFAEAAALSTDETAPIAARPAMHTGGAARGETPSTAQRRALPPAVWIAAVTAALVVILLIVMYAG